MGINTNIATELEKLFSDVRQISEQAIKAISDQEHRSKDEVSRALGKYNDNLAKKQANIETRNTEIAERLTKIEAERVTLTGQIASAISGGDTASAASFEAEVDSLNTEEYSLKRKVALFKSLDMCGDDALFECVIIKYRDYLAAKELARTEKNKINNVLIAWEEQFAKLLKTVNVDHYTSTFLDDKVAILLRRHEPVDIIGHAAGGHADALRRYLQARVKGEYDCGFEGTPAGGKLREMEGKPLYLSE